MILPPAATVSVLLSSLIAPFSEDCVAVLEKGQGCISRYIIGYFQRPVTWNRHGFNLFRGSIIGDSGYCRFCLIWPRVSVCLGFVAPEEWLLPIGVFKTPAFGYAAHAALEARAKYACEWAFNANKESKSKDATSNILIFRIFKPHCSTDVMYNGAKICRIRIPHYLISCCGCFNNKLKGSILTKKIISNRLNGLTQQEKTQANAESC